MVELDREAEPLPGPGSSPNRWAILALIVLLGVLGLSLLPAADIEPDGASGTLPDPAVATTLVGSRQPRVAFISDETFPMFVVSGLRGFVSLTEPVTFEGRWWIIGNHLHPTAAPIVLSSEDGRLWETSSEIQGDGGSSVRIDQLIAADGALIAVGSQGTLTGPSYYSVLSGNLGLWRSGDGVRWISETVDPGQPNLAFTSARLSVSGQSAVLQAVVDSTAPASAAVRLPSHVVAGISEGQFTIHPRGTRLVVDGPLGIQVAEAPMTRVSQGSSIRLFRSDSFAEWGEVEVAFSVSGSIVAAPEGGFLVGTGGVPFTSAYGISWKPNPRAYESLSYEQWGEGILGFSNVATIDLISAGEELSVQLPSEMAACSIEGSNGLLAAACSISAEPALDQVTWNGLELTITDRNWLTARDPATSVVREFALQRVAGIYNPDADTISLADRRGVREAFPVDVLRQLQSDSRIVRYDTMLSTDGLTWARSQIALRAGELELIGGIGDGFLVGTRSSEPGSTYTVLAADF
ncbi:MAG TPA: hypothetical protein VJ935_04725 [Acidimicrobiia bacterium]|nr:hypothetical protein [Acidimicrobiia bacterium]